MGSRDVDEDVVEWGEEGVTGSYSITTAKDQDIRREIVLAQIEYHALTINNSIMS